MKLVASGTTDIEHAISAGNSGIKEIFDSYKSKIADSVESDKLDFALVYRLLDDVHASSGNADSGLAVYQYVQPYLLGVPGYSVMSSPTIGIALQRLVKYYPLVTVASCINLDERCDSLVMTLHIKGSPRSEVPRYVIDAAAAAILGLVHWLAHPLKIQPTRVQLPYPEPSETQGLKRLLGEHLTFDAPHLSLSFSDEIREVRVFSANPAFEDVHCRYADALLDEQINGSLVERVRSVFSAGVAQGRFPSLQDVALDLRMSTRTLQKSLEREGATFFELQEELRKEIACNLLSIPTLSLKKVASILGFCQPSSLHKACRRWFGAAPGQFRASKSRQQQGY